MSLDFIQILSNANYLCWNHSRTVPISIQNSAMIPTSESQQLENNILLRPDKSVCNVVQQTVVECRSDITWSSRIWRQRRFTVWSLSDHIRYNRDAFGTKSSFLNHERDTNRNNIGLRTVLSEHIWLEPLNLDASGTISAFKFFL